MTQADYKVRGHLGDPAWIVESTIGVSMLLEVDEELDPPPEPALRAPEPSFAHSFDESRQTLRVKIRSNHQGGQHLHSRHELHTTVTTAPELRHQNPLHNKMPA